MAEWGKKINMLSVTSGSQAVIQEEFSAARIKYASAPKVTLRLHYSCIRPEDPVKRVHCSAVILYAFFAIFEKSPFSISMNNHVKILCIHPQFHWAVH